MRRAFVIGCVMAASLCGTATLGFAQPRFRVSPDPVTTEVGIFGSLWEFTAGTEGGVGGRMTARHSAWWATEASLEGKRADPFRPAQALLIVNGRLLVDLDGMGRRFYSFTAGGATGVGYLRTVSPMIGVGVHVVTPQKLAAIRVEFQRFPGGRFDHFGDTRMTMGVSILLR